MGSITVAGGIGWIIANQLVDVANQLPLYRQNIHAKIEAFHIPVTGQVGQAAESVREIVREITGPGTASPGPPAQRRNQKQPNAPPAPMPPMPVRMVESQPRRSTAATRALMVLLSRFLDWREALVIVKPRPAARQAPVFPQPIRRGVGSPGSPGFCYLTRSTRELETFPVLLSQTRGGE